MLAQLPRWTLVLAPKDPPAQCGPSWSGLAENCGRWKGVNLKPETAGDRPGSAGAIQLGLLDRVREHRARQESSPANELFCSFLSL